MSGEYLIVGDVAEGVDPDFIVELVRETKRKLGGRHINLGVTFAATMLLEFIVESERIMGNEIDWPRFSAFLEERLATVRVALKPSEDMHQC